MNLKVLFASALVITIGLFYFINQSNKSSAERVKQAEISNQKRLEQNKLDAINAEKTAEAERIKSEKAKTLKAEREKQDQYKKIQDSESAKIKAKQIESEELRGFKVVFDKWMTQDNIASSTARISIAGPVTELRKIRDELNDLQITGCLVGAKSQLMSAMDDEILMFVYFMQNDIRTAKTVETLKISYFNKLAEVMKQNTACKNK